MSSRTPPAPSASVVLLTALAWAAGVAWVPAAGLLIHHTSPWLVLVGMVAPGATATAATWRSPTYRRVGLALLLADLLGVVLVVAWVAWVLSSCCLGGD